MVSAICVACNEGCAQQKLLTYCSVNQEYVMCMNYHRICIVIMMLLRFACVYGNEPKEVFAEPKAIDTTHYAQIQTASLRVRPQSIYSKPANWTLSMPNPQRLKQNTAVLVGAFVSTLFVLELLPEDATSWNRAELQQTPFYERWYKNIFVRGPEWDHDNPIFNYVLHPYAGAVYFMSSRSCGYNFAASMLYSACVSTIGWEYGIEACMERPSIQDLFITPLVGSMIGEGFYRLKHQIVANGYTMCGSSLLGNIVVFLIDPVNEVINLFRGSDTRGIYSEPKHGVSASLIPSGGRGRVGFTLACTF